MKLIPARCPSCGADIEVNKNNETTKCKYCETRIFIDDAIAKYKVEIQNMPTAKSYLKVGTRNLNSRDFIKAHEQLEKALEIDPDNAEIIVKETLAKVLANEITESNLNKILNSFKEAKEFCDEDTLDELIQYTIDLMEPNRNFVTSVINSNPRGDVFTRMLYKYTFFLNFYERTFRNYAKGVEVKKQLIYKIFATVQCYLNGGRYTELNANGYTSTYTYKVPKDMIILLNNKKETYENELAKIDDEFRINLENKRQMEAERQAEILRKKKERERKIKELKEKIFGKSPTLIIDLCICLFLFIGTIGCLCAGIPEGYPFNPLLCMLIILYTPLFIFRIIEPLQKTPIAVTITIVAIRGFILLILFSILAVSVNSWVEKPHYLIGNTYVSNFSDFKMEIRENKIIITNNEEGTVEEYDYKYDYTNRKITTFNDVNDTTITMDFYDAYDDHSILCVTKPTDEYYCKSYYYKTKDAK